MFCNHCGAQIQADQRFCGVCGKSAIPAPPAASPTAAPTGRVAKHIRLLTVFWIALSALHLLRGGGRLLGARMLRVIGPDMFGDMPWRFGDVLPGVLSVFGIISIAIAVAGFVVGFGLIERRPWARTLAIVLAFIALLNPILGTILGIYTLWVLMPFESEAEYQRLTRAAS